jgi:peptide/nickel transport system permease protein
MRFWSYLLQRLGFVVPILLLVTVIVFVISHLIPGDPARVIAGMYASEGQVERLRQEFGLDRPLWEQYLLSLQRMVLHGDFGTSLYTNRPVLSDLLTYFPATVELTSFAMLLAIVLGIPLGVISARRTNQAADHVTRFGSLAGLSMPAFWLGLLLQIVFGFSWGLLPARGRVDSIVALDHPIRELTGIYLMDTLATGNWAGFRDVVAHIFLPGLVLALAPLGLIARMTRSSLLDVLREEYVKTARGAGLPEGRVVYRHALRNALIPTVTVIGSMYGFLLGGSFVVESVFDWPGIGLWGVNAILNLDFPAIIGLTLLYSLMRVASNIAVDLSYYFLDPQIKLAGKYEA